MKSITHLLAFFLLSAHAFGGGLKGFYTIDPKGSGSTNYLSFRLAAKALADSGVSGAVVFNISDGYYNESVRIGSISGASAVNTITFQSKSLDSTKVTLDTLNPGSSGRIGYTIRMEGTKYMIFRKITVSNAIDVPANQQADVIELAKGASHNIIENCIIYSYNTSTYSDFAGYGISSDATSVESNNIIRNNHIAGSVYGVFFSGISKPSYEKGNIFSGNLIDSCISEGIHAEYQDSLVITANKIYLSTAHAIGVNVQYGSKSNATLIANNFITLQSNNSFGLYCFENLAMNILFNSIDVNATGYSAGASFYGSNPTKTVVENNIFNNEGGSYAIVSNTNGLSTSNYNDIYSPGIVGNWNATDCTDFTDWQKSSKLDKNSVSVDPYFYDPAYGDLHLTKSSTGVTRKGIPLKMVSADIDGERRNSMHPNIGADENLFDTSDAGVTAVIDPVNKSCGSANTIVRVKVHNYGLDRVTTGFNVFAVVRSGAKTDTAKLAFTGVLDTLKDTIVQLVFANPFSTLAGGIVTITSYTSFAADGNRANDTFRVSDSMFATPLANFVFSHPCLGDTTHFMDSSMYVNGFSKYEWNFDNGMTSSSMDAFIKYLHHGNHTMSLKVTNASGCRDSITKMIHIDSVSAHFVAHQTSLQGDGYFTADDTTLKSYTWNFGDGSPNGSGWKAVHKYAVFNTYKVTLLATSTQGCKAIDSLYAFFFEVGMDKPDQEFGLSVSPNPFKDHTDITYTIPNSMPVKIEVYDPSGRLVNTLASEVQSQGVHTVKFLQSNGHGIYFLKMQFGYKTVTRKIIAVD